MIRCNPIPATPWSPARRRRSPSCTSDSATPLPARSLLRRSPALETFSYLLLKATSGGGLPRGGRARTTAQLPPTADLVRRLLARRHCTPVAAASDGSPSGGPIAGCL